MKIINKAYLEQLTLLKRTYANLPLYKRFWFSCCSYNLWKTLNAISAQHPTTEQISNLLNTSKKTWFFKSIFGLLKQFEDAVATISTTRSPFPRLPDEVSDLIAEHLTSDLVALNLSCNTGTFFQSRLKNCKFLHHVTRAHYDVVEKMLKNDSTLLTLEWQVTDSEGRAFSNITIFKYAFWSLDAKMCEIVCNAFNGAGEEIKSSLLSQYKQIKEKGVNYRYGNELKTEKHYQCDGITPCSWMKVSNLYVKGNWALDWDTIALRCREREEALSRTINSIFEKQTISPASPT